MMRRPVPATLALLLLALTLGPGRAALVSAGVGGVPGAVPAPSPLQPATTGGLAVVDRALAKLSTHRRMLVIGAHPDDEDTSLLTLVSRGQGGEAAYLALSRGEGGQNLIGPELGVGLGIIRTRELLAAREIDGGRQYFTRAFDFGFTRSLDETLKLWPKESVLEDVVRIVRRFKPQVIVSVFPGTPQAGHGQHQEAGVVAPEAYRMAGDPAAFPGLLTGGAGGEGLVPWKPLAFYRGAFFDRQSATMSLPLGGIDPLTGKSAYQLAMASRSMHRSQDMGHLQELGGPETRLAWVDGGAGKEGKGIFAGIDTHLAALAAPLPEGEAKKEVASHLAAAEDLAAKARAALSPERLADAAPPLAEILKHLEAARAALKDGQGEALAVADLLDEKIAVAETGLAAAAGIAVDAVASREAVTPGSAVEVTTTVWNGGAAPVEGVAVALISDWGDVRPAATGEAASLAERLAAGEKKENKANLDIPAGTPLTVPYFLRRPLQGDLYDWSGAAPRERGEPFGPPPLTARFSFRIAGIAVTLDREVVYRRQDEALGEVRRPLRVVPRVEVATAAPLLLWPLPSGPAGRQRRIDVTLTSHSAGAESGKLVVQPAASWPARASFPFHLAPGETAKIEVPLAATSALAAGRYSFTLTAELDSGEKSSIGVPVIEYPHIRPTPRPVAATVEVSAADLRLPPLRKVGYVRGASDRVPEFLLQVGVPLVLLGPADLLHGDLSGYDAIVLGSRAYETEPALDPANARLLDYAKKGGLVLVQYQQSPYTAGHYAPYALEIARSIDRVTDETAPVKLLDPASPVFTTPNRLGPADWEGWVQERGLYFAHTWGPEWKPLLAMADPGGPELQGSLLVARVGQGTYVYTGLALFRQLPAGVPGAYRLFANLLALGRRTRG